MGFDARVWWVAPLTSCSCSTAGRELAIRACAHVGSGAEAIAARVPADCCKRGREWIWVARSFICYNDISRIIPRLFVIFPTGLCGICGIEGLRMERNLRTMHWFPPGSVFQPGQQYEWKREPHTLGLTETKRQNKQTQYSPRPPKHILVRKKKP